MAQDAVEAAVLGADFLSQKYHCGGSLAILASSIIQPIGNVLDIIDIATDVEFYQKATEAFNGRYPVTQALLYWSMVLPWIVSVVLIYRKFSGKSWVNIIIYAPCRLLAIPFVLLSIMWFKIFGMLPCFVCFQTRLQMASPVQFYDISLITTIAMMVLEDIPQLVIKTYLFFLGGDDLPADLRQSQTISLAITALHLVCVLYAVRKDAKSFDGISLSRYLMQTCGFIFPDDAYAKAVARQIKDGESSMERLNLHSGSIGEGGAKELAMAIEAVAVASALSDEEANTRRRCCGAKGTRRVLLSIDLSGNDIGDGGAKDIALALKRYDGILALNLSNQKGGDFLEQTYDMLADLLMEHKTMMLLAVTGRTERWANSITHGGQPGKTINVSGKSFLFRVPWSNLRPF